MKSPAMFKSLSLSQTEDSLRISNGVLKDKLEVADTAEEIREAAAHYLLLVEAALGEMANDYEEAEEIFN